MNHAASLSGRMKLSAHFIKTGQDLYFTSGIRSHLIVIMLQQILFSELGRLNKR